jgi:hypothetical protein
VILLPRSKVNPFESPVGTEELPPEPETTVLSSSKQQDVTVSAEFFTKLFTMFAEKMNEGIEKSIAAARQVPEDPIKKKQNERAAESKRQAENAYWLGIKHKAMSCSHRRDDLTSAVGWMQCSDKVTRGVCQRCNVCFSPIASENACPEIHEQYKELIRIPTQKGNAVLYLD